MHSRSQNNLMTMTALGHLSLPSRSPSSKPCIAYTGTHAFEEQKHTKACIILKKTLPKLDLDRNRQRTQVIHGTLSCGTQNLFGICGPAPVTRDCGADLLTFTGCRPSFNLKRSGLPKRRDVKSYQKPSFSRQHGQSVFGHARNWDSKCTSEAISGCTGSTASFLA